MSLDIQYSSTDSIWEILTAIGTLAAVLVALFGRALFKPRLRCSLFRLEGHRAANPQGVGAWFWYVAISNGWSFGPATSPRLNITRIERFGVNWETLWDLPYPVSPANNGLSNPPTLEPNSKTEALFDAVSLWQGDGHAFLHFHPQTIPFSFPLKLHGPIRLRLTFIAVANEASSRPLTFEVDWDGQWAEPWQSMRSHVSIT